MTDATYYYDRDINPFIYNNGGFIQVRNLYKNPIEIPFQGREFQRNIGVTYPVMYGGGQKGYAIQKEIESTLRPKNTRYKYQFDSPIVLQDYGNMTPLIHPWQQIDYRSLHFPNESLSFTRNYYINNYQKDSNSGYHIPTFRNINTVYTNV